MIVYNPATPADMENIRALIEPATKRAKRPLVSKPARQ
jgi:hypothetical protein